MANLERLNSLTEGKVSGWREKAEWRKENRDWLRNSAKIAVRVLLELKERKMSQVELAAKMDVSAQYVSKIVKGKEKLNLETICKIEKALSIKLISILPFEETQAYTQFSYNASSILNTATAKVKSDKLEYNEKASYSNRLKPQAA